VFAGTPVVMVVGSVHATLWLPAVAPGDLGEPTFKARLERDAAAAAAAAAAVPRAWVTVHAPGASPAPSGQPGVTLRISVQVKAAPRRPSLARLKVRGPPTGRHAPHLGPGEGSPAPSLPRTIEGERATNRASRSASRSR
jgi:hypothetical protein